MKEQFKAVFDRWYETILLYAFHRIGDWDTAQEVAQETFIKLWVKGEEIIYSLEPQKWLHIVAHNLVTDRHRMNAAARKMEADMYYLTPDEDSKPEPPSPSSDIFDRLASLPDKCRAVIEMTLIGKKTGEIMAYLGISQQNVLNQKTRGIKLLREKIKITP